MECYCDYEVPSVYRRTTPKAKLFHRCDECNKRCIFPGETYERVFGIWEGDPSTFKTCQRCLDLKEYVKAHVPCFCWAHGNIIDDSIETARNYAHEAPGLLFGAYRRKVLIDRAGHFVDIRNLPRLSATDMAAFVAKHMRRST